MLARTVCETALARAKFVRNSKIFPFFCDSRANFAHQQAKKSFSKKLILNISAVFMADDEAFFIANTPADPTTQAIAKSTAPKKS